MSQDGKEYIWDETGRIRYERRQEVSFMRWDGKYMVWDEIGRIRFEMIREVLDICDLKEEIANIPTWREILQGFDLRWDGRDY